MKKILKLTLILFLVSAIVAGVLGVVNEVTKDRIAEQNRIKTEKAYAAVLPASGYEKLELDTSAYTNIDSVSKAAGGEGYVVQTTFSGVICVYDILKADKLVVGKAAVEKLQEVYAK